MQRDFGNDQVSILRLRFSSVECDYRKVKGSGHSHSTLALYVDVGLLPRLHHHVCASNQEIRANMYSHYCKRCARIH